jgi:hypothetical protein
MTTTINTKMLTAYDQTFDIHRVQWWNCWGHNDICDNVILNIWLIRDFMKKDELCYIVRLMIESELKREIVFV